MRRRDVIGMLGASIAMEPIRALAQGSAARPLIGWLSSATRNAVAPVLSAFRDGLGELGYEDGRDLDIVFRFGDDHLERLGALARELVQLKPNVLYASASSPAVLALREVTQTIAIVCPTLVNEIRLGLVESHARPGGSVTGISNFVEGLAGKLVELATQLIPEARKVGLLVNISEPILEAGWRLQRHEAESAGAALSVQVVVAEVREPTELSAALDWLTREGAQAMVVPGDVMFFGERNRISEIALTAKLPSIFAIRAHVEVGGLASYGVDLADCHRRAAAYVVNILKGAKPADLPIEFPRKLELVINLRTAKSLGFAVPPNVLARADEVIE